MLGARNTDTPLPTPQGACVLARLDEEHTA